jgi:hypothetical protein
VTCIDSWYSIAIAALVVVSGSGLHKKIGPWEMTISGARGKFHALKIS